MQAVASPLLAAAVAFAVAALELVTAKYPRTFEFIRRSWALYAYAALYAVIAFAVQLGWNALRGTAGATGFGLASPWVRALVVGISVKAFMHIRLFNVTVGAQSYPVGVESFLQLIEPWLLRSLHLEYLLAVQSFVGRSARHFPNLAVVQRTIADRAAQILAGPEQAGFVSSVTQAKTPDTAMELYLNLVGKRYFQQTFPLPVATERIPARA
jgi:hypothetical protein